MLEIINIAFAYFRFYDNPRSLRTEVPNAELYPCITATLTLLFSSTTPSFVTNSSNVEL